MQFFYHENAGMQNIEIDSKDSHYLFYVRRFKEGDILRVRNLNDTNLYFYRHIKKNNFLLEKIESANIDSINFSCNIILAIIDLKDIYDILPFLNALYVTNIHFFYADFSQKNRKIDMQKAQRIIQYSCMQSGRINAMNVYLYNNIESILNNFPKACYIDFNQLKTNNCFEKLSHLEQNECASCGIIIGPEGGFSVRERNILQLTQKQYTLNMPNILTTHLTGIYISSICFASYSNILFRK